MTDTTKGATALDRTTHFKKFFSCNAGQQALFAVNEGVSILDALEQASCFLDSAEEITRQAAEECNSTTVYAAAYLVEISKAIVDAATSAIMKECNHV
jgi:hypothetical protein